MKIVPPKGLQRDCKGTAKGLHTYFELACRLNFAWTIPQKSETIKLKIKKRLRKGF